MPDLLCHVPTSHACDAVQLLTSWLQMQKRMGVPARATGYSGIPGACSQSIYRMLLDHRCQLAALMLAHAFGKLAVGPDTPAVRMTIESQQHRYHGLPVLSLPVLWPSVSKTTTWAPL